MQKLSCYVLILGFGLLVSCEKNLEFRSETFCVQAKFVRPYHCTSSEPIQVVELLSPNPLATRTTRSDTSVARYYAAMLDLPDSVTAVNKTFYMRFHRDTAREKIAQKGFCTMEYAPVNILVCEGIPQSCP